LGLVRWSDESIPTNGVALAQVLKYPTIEDYRTSIDELDEKEYINLRLCTQVWRLGVHATLHLGLREFVEDFRPWDLAKRESADEQGSISGRVLGMCSLDSSRVRMASLL
jgi:hypothetical protein